MNKEQAEECREEIIRMQQFVSRNNGTEKLLNLLLQTRNELEKVMVTS